MYIVAEGVFDVLAQRSDGSLVILSCCSCRAFATMQTVLVQFNISIAYCFMESVPNILVCSTRANDRRARVRQCKTVRPWKPGHSRNLSKIYPWRVQVKALKQDVSPSSQTERNLEEKGGTPQNTRVSMQNWWRCLKHFFTCSFAALYPLLVASCFLVWFAAKFCKEGRWPEVCQHGPGSVFGSSSLNDPIGERKVCAATVRARSEGDLASLGGCRWNIQKAVSVGLAGFVGLPSDCGVLFPTVSNLFGPAALRPAVDSREAGMGKGSPSLLAEGEVLLEGYNKTTLAAKAVNTCAKMC